MFKNIITKIKSIFGAGNSSGDDFESAQLQNMGAESKVSNKAFKHSQIKLLIGILVAGIIGLGITINIIQEKAVVAKAIVAPEELKVELADKALDGDKMWRNFHEEELKKKTDELNDRIIKAEESVEETKAQLIADTQVEIAGLIEQLKMAKAEMSEANSNLKAMTAKEEERLKAQPAHQAAGLDSQDFSDDVELGLPKSARDYVPEGTYFTGYLLGGIVVSTSVNTADENATPVTIRLKGRGNLADENPTNISECRITGSAIGDLQSERAFIRLEKMTCKENGMYITSYIAGTVHGPDGSNGIKGEVVSTGSKHIQNAMLGSIISGLSSSVKGQEGMTLSAGGLISTKNKGFKEMASSGLMTGASNAGEKIADYHLRQADAMSPVLTIENAVRVNPIITKGFFIGEISTHRRIKNDRVIKKENTQANRAEIRPARAEEIQGNGGDDGWN
jgi:hypothetical protein